MGCRVAQMRGKGLTAAALLAGTLFVAIVLAMTVGAGPPGTPTMLNDSSHRVGGWQVTPDGSTVVYAVASGLGGDAGIWTVPSDGAAPPSRLVTQAVQGFTITPDGGTSCLTPASRAARNFSLCRPGVGLQHG